MSSYQFWLWYVPAAIVAVPLIVIMFSSDNPAYDLPKGVSFKDTLTHFVANIRFSAILKGLFFGLMPGLNMFITGFLVLGIAIAFASSARLWDWKPFGALSHKHENE